MQARVRVWLCRYLPAEAASVIGALLAAQLGWTLTGNAAVAAVAAAWGESVAYYATMLERELVRTHAAWLATLRELLLEFGLAEVLDTLFVRPALMYAGGQLVADLQFGVLLGKLGADVFFYVPTIAAYELRRRHLERTVASSCPDGQRPLSGGRRR